MDFSKLRFRCSSLGLIMTEPRDKNYQQLYEEACQRVADQTEKCKKWSNEYDAFQNKDTKQAQNKLDILERGLAKLEQLQLEKDKYEPLKDKIMLSETCKTHLGEVYVTSKYGLTKDIQTKYIEKGKILEEDAITMYSMVTKIFFEKNVERRFNEWIEGEMDFCNRHIEEIIHDTKVSWDIFTFYNNIAKGLNPIYYWQVQGYMWLWGYQRAKIIFGLLNTPKKFIEREKTNLLYNFIGSEEDYNLACEEIENKMTYDHIPLDERLIIFDVERNEDDIMRIPSRVEACREYLSELDKNPLIYKNKKLYELENRC